MYLFRILLLFCLLCSISCCVCWLDTLTFGTWLTFWGLCILLQRRKGLIFLKAYTLRNKYHNSLFHYVHHKVFLQLFIVQEMKKYNYIFRCMYPLKQSLLLFTSTPSLAFLLTANDLSSCSLRASSSSSSELSWLETSLLSGCGCSLFLSISAGYDLWLANSVTKQIDHDKNLFWLQCMVWVPSIQSDQPFS